MISDRPKVLSSEEHEHRGVECMHACMGEKNDTKSQPTIHYLRL